MDEEVWVVVRQSKVVSYVAEIFKTKEAAYSYAEKHAPKAATEADEFFVYKHLVRDE